jgi:hypothetical protein
MLSLDAWIALHSRKCDHEMEGNYPDETKCPLALARAVIAHIIVDVLARTKKGPIYTHRDSYLMSFGLQLGTKYFGTSTHAHQRDVHSRVVSSTMKLIQALKFGDDATATAVHAEIGVKLIAWIVEFERRNLLTVDMDRFFEYVLKLPHPVMNFITTKSQLFQSYTHDDSDTGGGYEISDIDIAMILVGIPRILPLIWSDSKKASVSIEASLVLLRSGGEFVRDGMSLGSRVLTGYDAISIKSAPAVVEWLQVLMEMATSFGSEEDMSLVARQGIYSHIHELLESKSDMEICKKIISMSLVDACIGIFVKIAKDIWSSRESDIDDFYSISRKVLSRVLDDHHIENACDSLKSILNWARLVYLTPQVHRDAGEDSWMNEALSRLSKKLDVGLSTTGDNSIAKTRLLFIGHLIARVRELVQVPV